MKDFPEGGFIGKSVNFIRYMVGLRVPVYAANASYFIVLAVFPALVLILSLLRYTGLAVETLTDLLEGLLPSALMPWIKKLILSTYQNTSGAMVSVSAVVALWSASRGIYGLHTGLNSIYEVRESRGYLYTRGMCLVYTLFFLAVLLLTLVLSVFGTTIVQLLPESPFFHFLNNVVDLRFVLLLVIQTFLFTAMFMVFPNKRNKLKESLPGAVVVSLGWLIFSDLFSIYVEHFTSYANIYGSVYAVALSMLWLYCCMCLIFYGGGLNHYRQENRKA